MFCMFKTNHSTGSPAFRGNVSHMIKRLLKAKINVLAITSPTGGGRSVGIVRSRTQTMEFKFKF
jgi:hypothetical protein